MKNVGDGFFLHPYQLYRDPNSPETKYQIIYSGSADGNPHIVDSVDGGLPSEAAAMSQIKKIKQDPRWKEKLENKIVFAKLRGTTATYQLENFERLFGTWSKHEQGLAMAQLRSQIIHQHKQAPWSQGVDYLVTEVADILKSAINSKENCTSYGEPQAFYELDNGRCIEAVLEQEGLAPEEYFYSVSLHCTEQEFDNGDFNSTCGVIDRYCTTDLNIEQLWDVVGAALVSDCETPIAEHSKEALVDKISAAEKKKAAPAAKSYPEEQVR